MNLVEATGLVKHFHTGHGAVQAIDGVDIAVREGETLGIVGESGCGKSTLGRLLTGLLPPDRGSVRLLGEECAGQSRRALRRIRPLVQVVFQNPYSSLNPRRTVGRTLLEPLAVHRIGTPRDRAARVAAMLERVGLSPAAAARYPHEFSGGQRQRIAIARAMMLEPRLILCDEAVSALDVSVQAQILNLLAEMKREFGLSYVFISHDLSVVRHIADRIAVMYLGRIVEVADRQRIWSEPRHPYTRALIASVPRPRPGRPKPAPVLHDDLPSPIDPPSGCRFRTRCPVATPSCAGQAPVLEKMGADHACACFHA
ncbi:ATP-binding cassette domain-containing protein [Paralimibaculum aggregatum]|uniref:ATP-binding cassette domain-containing protein n=1 Tax=Paralimibaculum aggregatum TaxID=3036245 RepID=A0ABQ6LSI0_9RHOB|nr:oligopeptide/dipeptide ABC transporter ATP-binding protein [Limibaculum sp. NKW23]GMG85027.1 ATP-binding cassette domain-containing protein [Limibaculum sp. NKW23]